MDFSAELDRDSKPNSGSLTIYNLAKSTREIFTSDYRSIEIYAGYGASDPPMVFVGSITSLMHEKVGVDWISTFQILDGGKEYFDIMYNKAFSKGTPIQTVLIDVANTLGLAYENSTTVTDVLLAGKTYSGKAKDVMTKICKEYNLDWSIQRGVLEINDKLGYPMSVLASLVMLGPDTGMVESPSIKEDGSIVVKSLMNPDIRPSRLVKLMPVNPSTFVGLTQTKNKKTKAFDIVSEGIFISDKVKYSLSNYGNEYYVEAECKPR